MSHAYAEARFSDSTVLYGEYDGTCDLIVRALYRTPDDRNAQWRKQNRMPICTCGGDESVTLWADYGHGLTWEGRACRACGCVTAGFDPYE